MTIAARLTGSSSTSDALKSRSYSALRQRVVLLKGAGETARLFYSYLQQPAAREVFVRYGFTLPQPALK